MSKSKEKKKEKNIEKPKVSKKILAIRIVLVILIALWTLLIFYLSGQTGPESSGLSTKVVRLFIKDEAIVKVVEPYARKLAHLTEYAINGMLFMLLFKTYDWKEEKILGILACFGVWYASLDEIHQLLIPDRAGRLYDVWIDWLGFMIGATCTLLLIKIIKMIKGRKK